METVNRVFENTYRDYLSQIGSIDLSEVALTVDIGFDDNGLMIPLMGDIYTVSGHGISGPNGRQPSFDVCVILARYVLMAIEKKEEAGDWTAFRDLKNAGPLEAYFRNDVETALISSFTGRLSLFKDAVDSLKGISPSMALNYDLAAEVTLLPGLPVIITFNEADDEFPASCSVLFADNAESWLDAESLAILARLLSVKLKKLAGL